MAEETTKILNSNIECRLSGNTLTGVALRYGEVAPEFNERIRAGAFGSIQSTKMNMQHDDALLITESAAVIDNDTELRISATLPAKSGVLELVRRGSLNGLSIEFIPVETIKIDGINEIIKAELKGVSLVDIPAYASSKAEVRKSERVLAEFSRFILGL